MDIQEIKQYAAHKLMGKPDFQSKLNYMLLYLQASQAESIERIAKQLEDGQFSLLEAENIANNIKLIADRLPD